jgi:hypothetical protein
LKIVAVHEFGHTLGLNHSDVEEAIMYPSLSSYNPNFKLSQDDIDGIQSVYGKRPYNDNWKIGSNGSVIRENCDFPGDHKSQLSSALKNVIEILVVLTLKHLRKIITIYNTVKFLKRMHSKANLVLIVA